MNHYLKKKLDFKIIGVARSGTSAFVSVLNKSPKIFCGMERFMANVPHSLIKLGDVEDKSFVTGRYEANLRMLSLKKPEEIILFGDKLPRFFTHINKSAIDFEGKFLYIYRDHRRVASSWNVRANNLNDDTWPNQRTGVFAFMDLIISLIEMAQFPKSKNILLVSYEELFYGNYLGVFDRLESFLPGANRLFNESFRKSFLSIYNNEILLKKPVNITENEEKIIDLFQIDSLFHILKRAHLLTYDQIKNRILRFISNLQNKAFNCFHEIALNESPQYYMLYQKQTPIYNQLKNERGFSLLKK